MSKVWINNLVTSFNINLKIPSRSLCSENKQYNFSHKQLVLVNGPCFYRAFYLRLQQLYSHSSICHGADKRIKNIIAEA